MSAGDDMVDVPVVPLAGGLRVEKIEGQRMIVVGPVAIAVPLSAESEAWLLKQLGGPATGIVVVGAEAMPR